MRLLLLSVALAFARSAGAVVLARGVPACLQGQISAAGSAAIATRGGAALSVARDLVSSVQFTASLQSSPVPALHAGVALPVVASRAEAMAAAALFLTAVASPDGPAALQTSLASAAGGDEAMKSAREWSAAFRGSPEARAYLTEAARRFGESRDASGQVDEDALRHRLDELFDHAKARERDATTADSAVSAPAAPAARRGILGMLRRSAPGTRTTRPEATVPTPIASPSDRAASDAALRAAYRAVIANEPLRPGKLAKVLNLSPDAAAGLKRFEEARLAVPGGLDRELVRLVVAMEGRRDAEIIRTFSALGRSPHETALALAVAGGIPLERYFLASTLSDGANFPDAARMIRARADSAGLPLKTMFELLTLRKSLRGSVPGLSAEVREEHAALAVSLGLTAAEPIRGITLEEASSLAANRSELRARLDQARRLQDHLVYRRHGLLHRDELTRADFRPAYRSLLLLPEELADIMAHGMKVRGEGNYYSAAPWMVVEWLRNRADNAMGMSKEQREGRLLAVVFEFNNTDLPPAPPAYTARRWRAVGDVPADKITRAWIFTPDASRTGDPEFPFVELERAGGR